MRLHFLIWIRKATDRSPKTLHVAPNSSDKGRMELSLPRMVVLLDRPQGVLLARLEEDGTAVGETLHGDMAEVERQLALEYGSGVEAWEQVPTDTSDPMVFARERLRIGSAQE